MATEKWKDFEKNQTKDIIKKINDIHPIELFDEETSRLQYRKLPFYKDRTLIKATEFASHPPLRMNFLQKDDGSIDKVDGTREGMLEINKNSQMRITKRNVLKYAKFFMSSVMTEEGVFRIVEDIEEVEFSDDPTEAQLEKIKEIVTPAKVEEKDNGFFIDCVMLYADAIYKAKLNVKQDGEIDIEEEEVLASEMPTRQIFLR